MGKLHQKETGWLIIKGIELFYLLPHRRPHTTFPTMVELEGKFYTLVFF